MGFSKFVVKFRKLILIISLLLCVPALFGMLNTRINYDMLSYLPKDLDTVKGQDALLDEFGKGAFSFIVVEGMDQGEIEDLRAQIEDVDHVESALWFDSFAGDNIPTELLPQDLYDAFNNGDASIVAVFFDTSSSADETMDAIRSIRSLADKKIFVSGASAMVTDLKDLAEKEEPIYVAIAVALALIAMEVFLDNWLIPLVFLASIGVAILINLGTNYFMGQISYITKALAAVLQLAVTMDYSIFLWHAYNEQRRIHGDDKIAMEYAIKETMTSIVGSSITTIAGFVALCFMSFTLGMDLGIVMAKGVVLGVIGTITFLPSLILCLNKVLMKFNHKSLIPDMSKFSGFVVKRHIVFLIIMAILAVPAFILQKDTQNSVYYNIGESMPADMDFRIANKKLDDQFDLATTHMVLVDSKLPQSEVRSMSEQIEDLDGVKYVLGLDSILPENIPEEFVPDEIKSKLESDNWKMIAITSSYGDATDEVNDQLDKINTIIKKYDENSLLIGEAPLSKDLIQTTDHDFSVVDTISIVAIFIIIAFVEKSISLPVLLISVIELAIWINLGIPYLLHEPVSFITPICISTIQLGATVDYAILMTTRYKKERMNGHTKQEAVKIALTTSIPSIVVSGMGLFAATFGVAVYSDINMISGMCMLMARGALISMTCVIFFLPALLLVFDKLIRKTTYHMYIKNEGKDVQPHEA